MTLFKIGFLTITVLDIVDILLVTWLFIKLYSYFRGTRAGQMLVGLITILLSSFVFRAIGMSGMTWIVDQVQTVWVVAFVILFQPELRRLLIYVGTTRFFQRLFKVGSSSMIDADIYSGDLLIVDRSINPKNNNIVIASIFGDLTVKKLKKKEKSFFLVPANEDYPSIEVKEEMECFIWGVVTYIIHETTSA